MTAKKIEELFSKIGEIQEDIQEIKSVLKELQADKVECTPSMENSSAINLPMTTSKQLDRFEKLFENDDDFNEYFEMDSIPVSTLFNRRKCLKERFFSKYVYTFSIFTSVVCSP